MLFKFDPVTLLKIAVAQFTMAHDGLDDAAAQAVFRAQCDAPPDGQLAGMDSALPGGDGFQVLGIAVADFSDRTDAEANQVALFVRGVALEVSLQLALSLCQGQFIIRQGKMIHADENVSGIDQPLDGEFHQLQLGGRGGYVFLVDHTLRPEQLGHVRVVVDSQPVRPCVQDGVQGFVEAFHRLQRQTINEVQRDRLKAQIARVVDQRQGFLLALDPVDGLLDGRVEILHPQADAVEPEA